MKTFKLEHLWFFIAIILLPLMSCKKNAADSSNLYVPTSADVTANATLQELKDGRALYINNCGACHNLYTPESFSPAQWNNILASMTPKTNLSPQQIDLVTKYVTKGK